MKIPTGWALMFPNLAKCISLLFSLSSSNVLTERIFSQLKLIKTGHINRLDSGPCSGLLKAKFWLKLSGCNPPYVDISDELLKHSKKLMKHCITNLKCTNSLNTLMYFNFISINQGTARTQSPTTKNCTPELTAFGLIARVSPTVVQWKGLALEEPPS